MPSAEMLDALATFDRGRLPNDPAVQEKLLHFELQAALASGESEKVLAAAQRLSEVSESGRDAAALALSQFQATADNPVLVLLQRMRLVDIHDDRQRGGFLGELSALAAPELPQDQLKLIVNTVLALLRQLPDDSELQMLLLRLLRQYGDQARAWQYALSLAYGKGPAAEAALAELEQAAEDEFTHGTRETLASVRLARGEGELAKQELLKLDSSRASAEAAQLAEALLDYPDSAPVRDWLAGYYRAQGDDALAASHVFWAQQSGATLDAAWMAKSANGPVLLRAAQVAGLRGEEAEGGLYEQALAAGGLETAAVAAAALRLAGFAEAAGEFDTALQLLERAVTSGADDPAVAAQRGRIELARRERWLGEVRGKPDSETRTLELVALLRELGDMPAAVGELQAAIGRGQTSPEMYLTLGETFTANNDLNLGRRAFSDVLRKLEAVENAPQELRLRANYGLASAEEALGNANAAISALEDILVISGSYRDTRERLNRLYFASRCCRARRY
jgi:hypothetical protein